MTTLSPPGSPTPQHEGRPRAASALSHSSNKSRRSISSSNKLDLTENHKDKKRLNTKSDPSKALNEATPAAVALEESNLEDLRTVRHKDNEGNVITDPDRSNPTRYRLERPLDTIRAFNAAAEGTSSRRSSFHQRQSPQYAYENSHSRRNSYYSNPASPQRPRPGYGGYYRNSSYGLGPQSSVEEVPGAAQMYGRNTRQQSNPYHGPTGDSPMSAQSQQYSYDNMTSGSDENGKSTNPSSQNSSFDQLHLRKPEEPVYDNPYVNELNFSPISPQKPYLPYAAPSDNHGQDNFQGPPPPAPAREYVPNNPRQPIKLNGSASGPPPSEADLNKAEKKPSWIKRRFSRRG